MRVAVVVAAMLFCMAGCSRKEIRESVVVEPRESVTNSIGMELIEIPIVGSSESQQMLSNFLDEPWTKYETAIATAEKSVVSTLTEEFIKQFDAAAALGDLDLVESIEAQQKEFKTNGTLPTRKSFESTLQARKKTGEDANTQLKKVYSNAIRDLTKQKRFAEARIVRDEMQLVFRDSKLLRPIRKNGYFRMGYFEGVAVTLTKPFSLGKYEVTQGQWKEVMGTEPWDGQKYVKADKDCPATYVSWDDATAFCQNLTEIERKAGKLKADEEYRLPTEAEWEYACRAGTTTAFSFGDDEKQLGEYAWFDGNAKNAGEEYAHKVGLKKPNPWGLHDMHGNVYEWCSDWYEEKLSGGGDPVGPNAGSYRVVRGGYWGYDASGCRSDYRGRPAYRHYNFGFRIVRVLL